MITLSQGNLQTTTHLSVLKVLQKRASRFNLHTPTMATETPPDTGRSMGGLTLEEVSTIQDMREEILQVHGDVPSPKADGVCRLIYENANGINNRMAENWKLDWAKEIINDLSADIVAYNKHRINLSHRSNIYGFRKMFQGGETELRAIAAHNAHNNVSHTQEGGTCLLTFGTMVDHLNLDSSGKDNSGLGRWVVMTFKGGEGFTTRVVCGYSPCYNSNKDTSTAYQQQRNYFLLKKRTCLCPRTKLRDDLITLLTEWRAHGDRLIVCLDANEPYPKIGYLQSSDMENGVLDGVR